MVARGQSSGKKMEHEIGCVWDINKPNTSKDNYLSGIFKETPPKKIKVHLLFRLLLSSRNTIYNLLHPNPLYKVIDCFFQIRPLLRRRCKNTLKLGCTWSINSEPWLCDMSMIIIPFCRADLILPIPHTLTIKFISLTSGERYHQSRSS